MQKLSVRSIAVIILGTFTYQGCDDPQDQRLSPFSYIGITTEVLTSGSLRGGTIRIVGAAIILAPMLRRMHTEYISIQKGPSRMGAVRQTIPSTILLSS